MTWVLVLSLTMTSLCKPGVSCPQQVIRTQPLPGVYQTEEACQRARETRQRLFAMPTMVQSQGIQQTITKTVECRMTEGQH